MANYCGYIVKIEKLRPHSNADRLQIATFFGNDTCVGLDVKIGDIGIYFPTDGQLSTEYCEYNNLVRKKDENGNNIGGYLDPSKRNVTAVRLRGERSDGLYMPLSSLIFTGINLDDLNIGDTIDIINGVEICRKYIPRTNKRVGRSSNGNHTRKKKVPVAPLFIEHSDTEQLAYNLGAFKAGDQIEITLKMHGTSQRTGYLPVLKGYKRTIWDILTRKEGTPIYDWGYVSGTRRTVLDNYEGGFYGSNEFREQHAKVFEGKLYKGEEIYYEVVGFTTTGAPIMGSGNNAKLNDKEFIKQYGDTTVFSYGCNSVGYTTTAINDEKWGKGVEVENVPQSDIYVYRMTMTNEDGDVIEYTPDFMRYRCEQMGVKTVPVLWKGYIPEKDMLWVLEEGEHESACYSVLSNSAGEWIQHKAEEFYDGPDPIGKTHIREGVVVRIINRPKFAAYKHKNFSFKCLSGIVSNDLADIDNLSDDILSEM